MKTPLPLRGAFVKIENSFFDLCVEAGQPVLFAVLEQDREDPCGPRRKLDPERSAGRAGTTRSEVTLVGRRIPIPRPRVRSIEGEELGLPSFAFASSRDPMDRHTLDAVACGISSRKYARSLDALSESLEERATSRSAVSRRHVAMTAKHPLPIGPGRSAGAGSSRDTDLVVLVVGRVVPDLARRIHDGCGGIGHWSRKASICEPPSTAGCPPLLPHTASIADSSAGCIACASAWSRVSGAPAMSPS